MMSVPEDKPAGAQAWRMRALVVSVALSVLGYLGVSLWGGWREVVASVGQVGTLGMLAALALSLINYGLRFVRWQGYLGLLGRRIPWRRSLRVYLSGFSLTTTPGKAGEALRSVFLKRDGVPYAESLAALFSERLSDLIAILLLASVGLWAYAPGRPVVGIIAAAVLVGLVVLHRIDWSALAAGSAVRRWPLRLAPVLTPLINVISHTRQCFRPRVMLSGIGIGLVAWGAEGIAFFYVADLAGIDLSLQVAMFIYAFAVLVGAISFLPGGLGGTEVTMVALLLLHGATDPQAVAVTLVIRLATLWFAVILGLLCLPSRTDR